MTSSLPSTDLLAILQADHNSKIKSGEPASLHATKKDTVQPPASLIHWASSHFFPFKNCQGWAESLKFILGCESTFYPNDQLFWLSDHLLFLLALASRLLVFERQAAKPEFGDVESWMLIYL